MQLSLNWVREFVDISDLTPEQISNALTMSGLEVEEIEKLGVVFENIKVVEIKEINPHPNADKLKLVNIFDGNNYKTVVCGASNIKPGQVVPYANVGSKVLSRKTSEIFTLEKATIRGIESEGMLCSCDELGLCDYNYQIEDGILILNNILENAKSFIGSDLKDALNLETDYILHTSPTANRPDEMSIVGCAREIGALFNKKLNFSLMDCTNNVKYKDFKVEVLSEDICDYYSIGIIKDLKLIESPKWMQKRLISSGMRPVNILVDVTNYVMLEYGQPLHVFDLDKIGNYLCVRKAKNNETIVTLDGNERKCNENTVLIANEIEPLCIAGVYGGINSGVSQETKNVAIEAAYFNAPANRKSARSVGYRSDASARFERGVDLNAVKSALYRAIGLLTQLTDCKYEGIVENKTLEPTKNTITLRLSEIKRILGIDIDQKTIINILTNLGFQLVGKNEMASRFEVPSYRANDVNREIDLIEEIARIYGLDKIPSSLPSKTNSVEINFEEKILEKVNNLFLGLGFSEAITSSLIGKNILKDFNFPYNFEQSVKVKNYQSDDFCLMRQSILPNILKCIDLNIKNDQKNIWLYEFGKTFFKTGKSDEKNTGVEENNILTFAMTGNIQKSLWCNNLTLDFFYLKGIVENIISIFGLSSRIKYQKTNESFLHPTKSCKIVLLDKKDIIIGYFGQLHPSIENKNKFGSSVYVCELNFDLLLKYGQSKNNKKYKKIPIYPSVQRDIAFIIEENIEYCEIKKNIEKAIDKKLISKVEIFDLYKSDKIKEGYKSVAFRITMQDPCATLTDDLINKQMDNINILLEKKYSNIEFRI